MGIFSKTYDRLTTWWYTKGDWFYYHRKKYFSKNRTQTWRRVYYGFALVINGITNILTLGHYSHNLSMFILTDMVCGDANAIRKREREKYKREQQRDIGIIT
jgi:hypothetical protein